MTEELKQAAQQALEALIEASGHVHNEAFTKVMMARDALVSALTQRPAAQEVVDARLWDLFIRQETVNFGDFKAEVRAAFDLEPTERDDKRAAFTEWLQAAWPMVYPKGCADDLWRNGHLATLALAWQAHIARKANIARQFQIARQSPQQATPEPVGEREPERCPACDREWRTEDCELGQEVARRLKAEDEVARLRKILGEEDLPQLLTDISTAAGLLEHGKRDKVLAQRIADGAHEMRMRAFLTRPAPGVPEDVQRDPSARPPAGVFVLAWVRGLKQPIRAQWVPKHFLEAGEDFDPEWGEYSDEKDQWFCPEGWYETNHYEETNWQVDGEVIAWTPLPALAAAHAKEGQA